MVYLCAELHAYSIATRDQHPRILITAQIRSLSSNISHALSKIPGVPESTWAANVFGSRLEIRFVVVGIKF